MPSRIWIRSQARRNASAQLLQEHLENAGFRVSRRRDARYDIPEVNWGIEGTGVLPNLNGEANRWNKKTALERFIAAGLRAPEPFDSTNVDLVQVPFPWLARKVSHRRGNDILKIETVEQSLDAERTHDFFVPYIEKKREYRVWVFRDKVLAVYSKRYQGEGKYEGVIWNHQDGLFKFVCLADENISDTVCEMAIMAVKSLHLDFGAVDMMQDLNGDWWLLEVNTAPSIETLERKSGIELAKSIVSWRNQF